MSEKEEVKLLKLSDESKKKMTEDLVVEGWTTYSFDAGGVNVEIKSLTWPQQKLFTKDIVAIPKEVDGKEISVIEYTTMSTDLSMKYHLVSIGGDKPNPEKTSEALVNIISKQIRLLRLTVEDLLSAENLIDS